MEGVYKLKYETCMNQATNRAHVPVRLKSLAQKTAKRHRNADAAVRGHEQRAMVHAGRPVRQRRLTRPPCRWPSGCVIGDRLHLPRLTVEGERHGGDGGGGETD